MKSLTYSLVMLVALLLFGCAEKKPAAVPVGEMQEYKDPGYGFKIKYPKDWKQLGQIGKAVFAKSDDVILRFQDFKAGEPGGMVTVTVLEYQGRTAADLMTSSNDEMKQYAQMQPEQQVQAAGKPSTRVDYSFQATKKNAVKGFVVYVPGDTALYAVDFKGYGDYYEAHDELFKAMLASFEIPVVVAAKSDEWSPKSPTDFKTDYFTLMYPEDINITNPKKQDKDYIVEFIPPGRNDCSIVIDVFDAKKLTVEKVFEQNKARYKNPRGNGNTSIDGNNALWIDYAPVKDINSRAYHMVKNNKVVRVIVNWYAPKKDIYFPAFEKIVNSIKLK